MKFSTTALFLTIASMAAAQGTQFITGPCTSDADCASGCCGFNTGRCAGAVVALERDGGCGFGDAEPNGNAAAALGSQVQIAGAADDAAAPAADTSAAVAPGSQFITGPCAADADCGSGCCGFNTGLCAGAVVAQERDGGCGFGDAQPNDNAAQALTKRQNKFITQDCANDAECADGCCGFNTGRCAGPVVALERDGGCGSGDAEPNRNAAAALGSQVQIAGVAAEEEAAVEEEADVEEVEVAAGTQFITGPCSSDADCADGCCGFNSGLCAGPAVAQERDGGCGFGDAQPNDNALQALSRRR